MEKKLYDDETIEQIDIRADGRFLCEIVTLDQSKEYKKLIEFIETKLQFTVEDYCNFNNLDYESAKFLLNYAKNNNMKMYNFSERRLLFLSRLDPQISKRLFIELGYASDINLLVANIDSQNFGYIKHKFEDVIPFSEEEIRQARKKFIKDTIKDNYNKKTSLSPLIDCTRVIESNNYIDYNASGGRYSTTPEYLFASFEDRLEHCKVSHNVYCDLISEYIFDDKFQNIFTEISELFLYFNQLDKREDYESFKLFQEFLMFLSSGFYVDIIEMIENGSYKDIAKIKNSLMNKYKKETADTISNSVTTFTKEMKGYNQYESLKHGCDVYYLEGEDFKAFARTDIEVEKEQVNPRDVSINRLSYSFSYIGGKNIRTYKDPNRYLTMLYYGVGTDNIGHVYHDDSFSGDYGSFHIEGYYTADSLLERSQRYPEIWMKDFSNIKSFAILCYDEATEWDYEVARLNNLSVVILNTKEYVMKDGIVKIDSQRI